MLNENNFTNNLNIKNNQDTIENDINTYNKSKNPNTTIPKSSNYKPFTKNEYNNEYMFARYPNGIINLSNTVGNKHKVMHSSINLNNTINKNTSNTSVSPKINLSFPTQSYNYESFSNLKEENFIKSNKINYLIIFCILILIWIIIKIKKH